MAHIAPLPCDSLVCGGDGTLAAAAGRFGRMVRLEGSSVRSVELSVVPRGPRPADPELYEVARVFCG